jgi:dUTP pyrophosphatase
MRVKIQLIEDGKMPTKAHETDAGFDCYARKIEIVDGLILRAHLGFRLELPPHSFADIRPRSSIYKTGLTLCNSPGTIDEGYRGEIVANFYRHPWHPGGYYKAGDRVCQMIIRKRHPVELELAEINLDTERGEGGFGSSGK